jgi:hypothetical protein
MDTHPNILAAEDSLLLIVGIQTKLTAAMPEAKAILDRTGKLITATDLLNIPVLLTEQYRKGIGPTERA